MGGGGSVFFSDVRDFEARLPGRTHLALTNGGPFRARLTWVELRGLVLLHAREAMRRVAYFSLPANSMFAFFPVDRSSILVCDGTEVRAGDIVLYHDGARTHQRTLGAVRWSSASLDTATLRDIGMVLTGRNVIGSPGVILRSVPAAWRLLSRLHSESIRIAETRLPLIDHPEVARALEQELIRALVNCLSTAEAVGGLISTDQRDVLTRFETCLLQHAQEPLPISAICKSIHVSERALRELCSRVLGMSPMRYQRLRALAPAPGNAPHPDRRKTATPSDNA
jgi:AraC-like DNA-binding protein